MPDLAQQLLKSSSDSRTSAQDSRGDAHEGLQWLRELITAGISVAILWVAVLTIWGTWKSASTVPDNDSDGKKAAAQKEAYERQKDIMLYAVALLGTVTGYYLGRAPAELHAQQAQGAANTAHQQLERTQSKLTDAAATAAAAQTQLTVEKNENQQAQKKVQDTRRALESISRSLGEVPSDSEAAIKNATLRTGESTAAPPVFGLEQLRYTKAEVDSILRQIA